MALPHAGIYVHRQITDEKKWSLAMQAVYREFKDDDILVEKRWTLKHEAPSDDPMYWIKMSPVLTQADVWDLQYAEPLNFGPGANFYQWESLGKLAEMGFTCAEQVDKFASGLKSLLAQSLQEPNIDQFELQAAKDALAKARNINDYLQSLSSDEKAMIFQRAHDRKLLSCRPPILFELTLGDHPCLPLFGRHFRICESKLSGPCEIADAYIRGLYRILKEFFPENISDQPPETLVVKLGDPSPDTQHFYEKLRAKMEEARTHSKHLFQSKLLLVNS